MYCAGDEWWMAGEDVDEDESDELVLEVSLQLKSGE